MLSAKRKQNPLFVVPLGFILAIARTPYGATTIGAKLLSAKFFVNSYFKRAFS